MLGLRRRQWLEGLTRLGTESLLRLGIVALAAIPAVLTKAYAASRGLSLGYQLALTVSAGVCILALGLAATTILVPRLPAPRPRAERLAGTGPSALPQPADLLPPPPPPDAGEAPSSSGLSSLVSSRSPDIGSWQRSITADAPAADFDGLRWAVLGVDVFSRAIAVRMLLTGRGVAEHVSRYLANVTATGPAESPLQALGGTTANTFGDKTRNLVLVLWFSRPSQKPLDSLAVTCNAHRMVLVAPSSPDGT